MFSHLEEEFAAFGKLWRGRNAEHISLVEIEAYARLYSVHDTERFADLIIAAEQEVFRVAKEVEDKRKDRKKRMKTIGPTA